VLAALRAQTPPEAIVDDDYRFRLARPGGRWFLFGPGEVTKLLPDAAAGANNMGQIYGVIIVEWFPQGDAAAIARALIDIAPLEEKAASTPEPIEFHGLKAVRYRMTGVAGGIRFRYQDIVFVRQGHVYQVLAWGLAVRTAEDGSDFEPFVRAFTLLDGTVKGRAAAAPVPGSVGIGWRVKSGIFESAVHGIAVAPRGNWRVVVGVELRKMNADAAVGLALAQPSAQAVVIVGRAVGVDRKVLAGQFREQTRTSRCREASRADRGLRGRPSVHARPVSGRARAS
jgi:hypothetical protein